MRLVWRAAVAFAERGWPVLPWDGGALEPFASADPSVVEAWGSGAYASVDAACDLEAAGLFVVRVDADVSLLDLFGAAGCWPDSGCLTVVDGEGRWLWFVGLPEGGVSVRAPMPGVELVTAFVTLPGCGAGGRLEHDADLAAAVCPGWLADLASGRARAAG